MPQFPDIEVQLTGQDGNAFFIIARVTSAMREAGIEDHLINAFREEAMSGNYDDLLRACMRWVSVS